MSVTEPQLDASVLATVLVIALVGIGIASGAESARIDHGNASVGVVSIGDEDIAFESGRFGTAASYLRLPDVVAHVRARSGTPRIHYRIVVPDLGLDRHETRLIRREGRHRVRLADVAVPPNGTQPPPGRYAGRMVVRVQSFSTDRIVLNRSLEVRVPA